MKKFIKSITLVALASVVLVSCLKNDPEPLLESYIINEANLHPEGIAYSSSQEKIFVGSYRLGKIMMVDLEGNTSEFVDDDALITAVGIKVDDTGNRLVVTNSDLGLSIKSDPSTIGQIGQILIYDLTTGNKTKTIDLASLFLGGHFLNDLTIDNSGNIYVTDSFSPVIYKIDINGNGSVLVNNPLFQAPEGAFGLNGIVYHPDNFLIVGMAHNASIYKVPLNNPDNVQLITLNQNVNSLDGLLLDDDNTLLLASNYFQGPEFDEAIYKIETTNNWSSGSVTSSTKNFIGEFPTTMTHVNDATFVSVGFFRDLVDPTSPVVSTFTLQKIKF